MRYSGFPGYILQLKHIFLDQDLTAFVPAFPGQAVASDRSQIPIQNVKDPR